MSPALTPGATRHHPPSIVATVAVLVFLGLTATGGGTALVLDNGAAPPRDWLDEVPVIDTWFVPGVVLGGGFGLGSLFTAHGLWRTPTWRWLRPLERRTRHHWSWTATISIGIGQLAWIGVELMYLEPSFLHAVYAAVGLALVVLPLLPAVRTNLRTDPPRAAGVPERHQTDTGERDQAPERSRS